MQWVQYSSIFCILCSTCSDEPVCIAAQGVQAVFLLSGHLFAFIMSRVAGNSASPISFTPPAKRPAPTSPTELRGRASSASPPMRDSTASGSPATGTRRALSMTPTAIRKRLSRVRKSEHQKQVERVGTSTPALRRSSGFCVPRRRSSPSTLTEAE